MADHFKVASKLAGQLASKSKTPEYAIRELVDNAWDADATHVDITLPSVLTRDPIVIEDDGRGMSRDEVSREFLFIARDRRKSGGEKTPGKRRSVKGQHGIGKFAGLQIAGKIELQTWREGRLNCLQLLRQEFDEWDADIQQLPIDIITTDSGAIGSGTRATLCDMNQSAPWPVEEKLAELLLKSYGQEDDFDIAINRIPLTLKNLKGQKGDRFIEIEGLGTATLHYVVSKVDVGRRLQGLVVYYGGRRAPGKFDFGLKDRTDLPAGLLKKITGVLDITPNPHGRFATLSPAVLKTSEAYVLAKMAMEPILFGALQETFYREINLLKARVEKDYQQRLAELPEYKRPIVKRAIEKLIINRFGKKAEDIRPLVNVVLDAVEYDEYATILRKIDALPRSDVMALAEALEEFGLCDMAQMMRQARSRMDFLEKLERLAQDETTRERELHRSLENNLWVFGPECALMTTERTLKTIVTTYLDGTYVGDRASDRPDLLLAEGYDRRRLLVEFKRPSHVLRFADYQQATRYRSELLAHGEQKPTRVMLVGGKIDPALNLYRPREEGVEFTTYLDMITTALKQLRFLLEPAR